MKLMVITTGSYPFGGASTNRHLSYLTGLVLLNVEVTVLILQPDNKQSILSRNPIGTFNGIQFQYSIWYDHPKRFFIFKIISRIYALLKTIVLTKKFLKTNSNNDVKLLVLLISPYEILPFILVSRKFKIPIFHERTEYPFLNTNGLLKKLSLKIYLNKIIPKFDGIFVISRALVSYFESYVKAKKKVIHLPMTVELERFDIPKRMSLNLFGKYIAYCGSMYSDKDGVGDLIEAFNIFCRTNKEMNLLLIGDNSDTKKFCDIKRNIDSSPFKNRIFCSGWIERDEMPQYLVNADLLALARPDNIQARGGFPTKLGEYLSTGNPVIITDVGEHSDYLTDGISAYISKPCDPFSFAMKLLLAAKNPVEAKKIGEEGKRVAIQHFNYRIQAQKLRDFLNSQ